MASTEKTTDGEITITRLSRSSWFKIEIGDRIIYLDPGYAGYFQNQGIPLDELNDMADVVFVTQYHKGNLQPEARCARIITPDTLVIAPGSCKDRIRSDKVRFIKPEDTIKYGDIIITAVDAYNTQKGHSTRKVHHKGEFVGYLIHIKGMTIYFAGNADVIPEMSGLGKVDLAFLPIGETFVMDIEDVVDAVGIMNPRVVFSMHQSAADPHVFERQMHARSGSRVIFLDVGEIANV